MTANNFIESIIIQELESGKVDKVVTRFPPEPNGYLHIGHAKSICLNFETAKKFGGKCNLRFDDTNPIKEEFEFVESIMQDVRWLGYEWDKLFYASDFFDELYELAKVLILKGKAYVCELSADEIRQTRGTLTQAGTNSPYRSRDIEQNLKLFEQMKDGKYADGQMVLRAKIDMASPNINMRDPVIYRILRATHHRTGDKWCIYPMYDFTHPLCDALEGITHSICTLEFEDHRPLYDWFVNECGFEHKPRQIEFARLNITNTVMSKRYLKKLVEEKLVDGWSDPRMPTISGLRKRGFPPEALREFCDRIGVAKANSEVEAEYLEHFIRENLNINANRAMAVADPILVKIQNYQGGEAVDFDINPNKPELGTRKVDFSGEVYIDGTDFSLNPPPKYYRLQKGGMVRLKNAYIIKCDDYVLNEDGSVKELICSQMPNSKSGADQSGLKVKGVIQWVDKKTAVAAQFTKYSHLINDGESDFDKRLNADSKSHAYGFAERHIFASPPGTAFQLMRMGYYITGGYCEKTLNLSEIVPLKDTFNKKK